MNNKLDIAVFFGGASSEHDVSIITGQYIISELKKLGHNPIPVYIGQDHTMYSDPVLGVLAFFREKKNLSPYAGWGISSDKGKLVLQKSGLFGGKKMTVDIAYTALHGTNGEDGAFQGAMQLLGVPFIGSPLESSVIAMNKTRTKELLKQNDIPTPRYCAYSKQDWEQDKEAIIKTIEETLTYPVVTKPPHAGSSIGISFAKNKQELLDGIELALHYDTDVLVEEGVSEARDITIAVLGNDDLRCSVTQESHSSELLSYEDKYINDGGAQFGGSDEVMTIPADIDDELKKKLETTAQEVYKILGMQGTARVDFLVSDSNEFFVIEVNPLPGTLYNHLWEKSGLSGSDLVSRLIELGFEAHKKRGEYAHEFNSSILQHANNMKLTIDQDEQK